jgi:hypothetical protein
MKFRPCPCGSGLDSTWACDARGIELKRTCLRCHAREMRRWRPEVLTNPNYLANEPIEPE